MIKALQRKEELKTLCKVPDMILDEHERRIAIFDSRNGLVEDPKAEHDAEKFIRPWTEDEIRVYHEKVYRVREELSRRIAKHLPGRNTADCVVYYYRNQKTSDGSNREGKLQRRRGKCITRRDEPVRLGYTVAHQKLSCKRLKNVKKRNVRH